MKMKTITILLLFPPFLLLAQDQKVLKPEGMSGLGSLLGSGSNAVKEVRIIYEDNTDLSIEVQFNGFDDKAYEIKGEIQNRLKKPIRGIAAAKEDLPRGGNTVDLQFEIGDIVHKETHIGSSYLLLTIVEKKKEKTGGLFDFDMGSPMGGQTYRFKYSKKWRVTGGGSTINVTATPYKSAANIRQSF